MIDDVEADLSLGPRVRVRTRYGWEFTGELRKSAPGGVRMFDPVIGDVVRLNDEEVVEIALVHDDSPVKRAE